MFHGMKGSRGRCRGAMKKGPVIEDVSGDQAGYPADVGEHIHVLLCSAVRSKQTDDEPSKHVQQGGCMHPPCYLKPPVLPAPIPRLGSLLQLFEQGLEEVTVIVVVDLAEGGSGGRRIFNKHGQQPVRLLVICPVGFE